MNFSMPHSRPRKPPPKAVPGRPVIGSGPETRKGWVLDMGFRFLSGVVARGLYPVTRFMDRITWVILFFMMMMTMIDVLLRKLFNASILGTVEMTEMSMAVVVFFALAECQVHDGHIKVDLVLKKCSPRVQALCDVFTQLVCFLLFCFMTVALFRHAESMRGWGEVTLDLAMPVYPFVYAAALGTGLLALVLLVKGLVAFSEAFER